MGKDRDNLEDVRERLESVFERLPIRFANLNFQDKASEAGQSNGDAPDAEEEAFIRQVEHFDLKPKDLRDYLDRYVVKQSEAKKVLSVAICDHYNHVRECVRHPEKREQLYLKQNVLVLGPTGVGKTYLIRNIARRIGVPFVKADATKFSETGYVGGDAEDLVRDLVKAANGNVNLAQYGIIYVDEIDKIASTASGGKDVSGRGVQVNLLKLMEETDVNLVTPHDMIGQMRAIMSMQRGKRQKNTINTRHILFIFSGAFDKLSDIVKRRLDQGSIGFNVTTERETEATAYLRHVQTQDFIQFGFEPEFIGRIPVRVACDPLVKEDLARILTDAECSVLQQTKADFSGYGIDMTITREAIDEIAARAEAEKTGARGLMTIFERILRNFKFELPSSGIDAFEVNTDTVAAPEQALQKLLLEHRSLANEQRLADIHAFEENFFKENNIRVVFSEDGISELVKRSIVEDRPIAKLCKILFGNLGYGLKMIETCQGLEQPFVLDKAVVQDSDAALSEFVKKSFKGNA